LRRERESICWVKEGPGGRGSTERKPVPTGEHHQRVSHSRFSSSLHACFSALIDFGTYSPPSTSPFCVTACSSGPTSLPTVRRSNRPASVTLSSLSPPSSGDDADFRSAFTAPWQQDTEAWEKWWLINSMFSFSRLLESSAEPDTPLTLADAQVHIIFLHTQTILLFLSLQFSGPILPIL
jgi:hypothetical protein